MVQARVSGLHKGIQDSHLPWAKLVQGTGNAPGVGSLDMPIIGSKGWVYYPEDDEHHLYYMGADNFEMTQLKELLVDYPNSYGRIDQAGNLFMVNTTKNTLTINMAVGHLVQFTSTGVSIAVQGDFLMHATGNAALDCDGTLYLNGSSIETNVSNPASSLQTQPRQAPSVPSVASMIEY